RQSNTELLQKTVEAPGGVDPEALFPQVYDEMRNLAGRYFRDQPIDHTLQATALVHEAYCKLVDADRLDWRGKSHFMAIASKAMRQVLVDHFRAAKAQKRGGDWQRQTLDAGHVQGFDDPVDLLAVTDAIDRLAQLDERQARVVELRFFTGLSNPEIAEALGVSLTTVEGEWRHARAWLARELASTG
ncbi:MAG: sigma-70 family RNA polymerase sigma factor, partial [Planctomycetes bacterium]|nr:sigma-70 family RNA polymerase sigma factor [Planctomycetota bacterium]